MTRRVAMVILAGALASVGCSPDCISLTAFSDSDAARVAGRCENRLQEVRCYAAGGTVILTARTRGIAHYQGGAMVFTDLATGQTVRATGSCTAINLEGGQ